MDKQDVARLFTLLETLCPSAGKKQRDNTTLTAWALVLEPFDYEDVKAAAVARARENRYFPDPAELVAYLPQRACAEHAANPGHDQDGEGVQKLRERWDDLVKQRKQAGVPATITEARKSGMTAAEWYHTLAAAGFAL